MSSIINYGMFTDLGNQKVGEIIKESKCFFIKYLNKKLQKLSQEFEEATSPKVIEFVLQQFNIGTQDPIILEHEIEKEEKIGTRTRITYKINNGMNSDLGNKAISKLLKRANNVFVNRIEDRISTLACEEGFEEADDSAVIDGCLSEFKLIK